MKKVIILGASHTQVPLIQCVNKIKGLSSIVISVEGNYPGFSLADKFYFIDTRDYEKILKIAKQEEVSGILTTGTDVAVKSIGYVNSKLNLSGITYDASKIVTDKAKMKKVMVSNNVKTAPYGIAYSSVEAKEIAKELSYPVMVKCTDQAASKGISCVYNEKDMIAAFDNSISISKNPYVVIEKFISGKEIGLDGFVDKFGKIYVFFHNKITYNNGLTNIPIAHSVPFIDEAWEKDIYDQVFKMVSAIGLKSVFFNMDLILSNDGVYVLEIGGRTGSTCIPDILSEYYGFNYYRAMIDNALGQEITLPNTPVVGACFGGFIFSDKSRHISNISIDDNAIPKNTRYSLDVSVGDDINKFSNGSDRIGQLVCCADSLYMAELNYKNALREILKGIV